MSWFIKIVIMKIIYENIKAMSFFFFFWWYFLLFCDVLFFFLFLSFFLSFFCLKDIVNVEIGHYDALNRNNEERIKKGVNDFIYIISETVSWIKTINATINALISLINLKQKIIWGRIDQNEYELTKWERIDQMKTRWVRLDQKMSTSWPKWVRIDLGTNWLEYELAPVSFFRQNALWQENAT